MFSKSRLLGALGAGLMVAAAPSVAWAAAEGGFLVHINQQQNNSDSRRSISFYDTDDIAAGPLFSVFVGFEGGTNFEDLSAITVDPVSGDVYVLGFDSGTAGVPDTNGIPDSQGTFDIYKVDFQAAYNYWETNFQGQDARGTGLVNLISPAPAAPNSANLDYVTFGNGPSFTDFSSFHSNTVGLPGVVSKLGEVNQNNGGNFFPLSFEFVSDGTLLVLDDSSELQANDNAAFDHGFRTLQRVSASPGAATSDGFTGGYNLGTTESWESRQIALVNLDTVAGVPTGHSEPESTAFYHDPVSGVRGVWVTENDGGGDDVAFLELDANGDSLGYRPHAVGAGPNFPTSFALDDDPFVNSSTNDGQADNIFVDADTGDLIIIESGFGDAVEHEPGVIRRQVLSYDDGTGKIQFGAWGEKVILNPVNDQTSVPKFLERGAWTAYDSVNDTVYFFSPDSASTTGLAFAMDIFALDLNTGLTTSYLDVDESVSMFFTDSFGDLTEFFCIGCSVELEGDLNGDGFVGLADLDIVLGNWNANVTPGSKLDGDPSGDGFVGLADLDTVLGNWNAGTPPSGNVVPEPASLALFTMAGLTALGRRRSQA